MTVIELLKKEHEKMLGLIEHLEGDSEEMPASSKEKLFGELEDSLELHLKIEERIFYQALEHLADARALMDESFKEQRRLIRTLEQLRDLVESRPADVWKGKLGELKLSVERHIQKEERELFPAAEKHLGEGQLREMFFEAERLKSGQSLKDSLIYPADRFGITD